MEDSRATILSKYMSDRTPYIESPLNKSRQDKFIVVLNIPEKIKRINSKIRRDNKSIQLDTLQFSVWGTVVPPISVPAVNARFGGGNMPISSHSHPEWPPLTFNFHIDNLFNNYWVIYQWLNMLRDQEEGRYGIADTDKILNYNAPPKDYQTPLTIYAVDEFNKKIIEWKYLNAFPTNLSNIDWNEQVTGEIPCTATFQFSRILCTLIDRL